MYQLKCLNTCTYTYQGSVFKKLHVMLLYHAHSNIYIHEVPQYLNITKGMFLGDFFGMCKQVNKWNIYVIHSVVGISPATMIRIKLMIIFY